MLSDKSFAEFAEDYVLFCHITSRIEGEPYPNLLKQRGGTGFPTFAYLDAKGELVTKYRGSRSVEGFRAVGQRAQAYLSLERAVEKGEASRFDLLLAGLDLGKHKLVAARRMAKELKDLNAEQEKQLEESLLNLEVNEGYAGNYRNERAVIAMGRQWFALAKEGKVPTDAAAQQAFWTFIASYGKAEKDAKARAMARDALKGLKRGR